MFAVVECISLRVSRRTHQPRVVQRHLSESCVMMYRRLALVNSMDSEAPAQLKPWCAAHPLGCLSELEPQMKSNEKNNNIAFGRLEII